MNDAVLVCRFERLCNLTRDGQGFINRNRRLRDAVRECWPLDQLQHERLHTVRFLKAVDRRDVRVVQRGEDLSFSFEACKAIQIERELFGQDF